MLMHTLARRLLASSAALAIVAAAAHAEPLLFDNGTFVTGVGTGPGGTDISQADPSPGVITIGFNANAAPPTGPLRVGDDFIISGAPAGGGGVRLNHMHFYGVQSNSITTNVQFGAIYVAIYNASPAAGGTIIAGDFTTNRLRSSTWTNAYRLSSSGSPSTSRPITRLDVDMSWVPALQDGTYFMMVSAVGDVALTANPNPQAIFVTPHRVTDNGLQYANSNYIATYDYPFKLFGYCPADFNFSGGTTIDDLFLYFNAWFTGALAADFNNQDGVTIDDLFLYINAWFGTC